MRRAALTWLAVALVGWAGSSGCASWYQRSADREVGRLLATYGRSHPERPVPLEEEVAAPDRADRDPPPPDWLAERRVLDLPAALEVAITCNRDYLRRRETLYLTALVLTGERHRLGLRPALSFEAQHVGGAAVDGTISHSTLGRVSKTLLFGGTVSLTGRQDAALPQEDETAADAWTANAAIELTQPLLRGFGYEASHDALIQARRDLIYDLRDFVQFRQDFAIQVAQAYWGLQQQRERVVNQERSLKRLEELKRRADARFDKGAAEAVDRFRANREVLRARDDLNNERRAYALALDQFKVLLGVPVEVDIDVADDRPVFRSMNPDLERAVRAALVNRLDLKNDADRAEDAERTVRVARRDLLAALDLLMRYENETDTGTRFGDQRWGDGQTTFGLRLEVPVDRKLERNTYRRALVDLDRARRAYSLTEDQVLLDVRERIRELRVAEAAVDLQRLALKELEGELEMANIRVERGEASNRDVVDAETQLLLAQNRLVEAEVNHAVARLRFLRSIGTLEIDEKGMWRE